MLPASGAVAFLLVALVPGWAYLRMQERLRPPSDASGIHELLEVVAVGLATTGTAAVPLVLLPRDWLPFVVDFERWAAEGDRYLQSHLRLAVGSAAALLTVALLAAYGLYRVQRLTRHAEFRPSGNVLVHSLGARPRGHVPYVGLRLEDGSLVEGVLHSFSLKDVGLSEQAIALRSPIRVTPPGSSQAYKRDELDRVIVPGRVIAHMTVMHRPERARARGRSGRS